LYGLLELAKRNDIKDVFIHAFTDGRDSPPNSGAGYIADIEKKAREIGVGTVASVMGRFYAMDRDSRWERVQKAYECLRTGKGIKAASAAGYQSDTSNDSSASTNRSNAIRVPRSRWLSTMAVKIARTSASAAS